MFRPISIIFVSGRGVLAVLPDAERQPGADTEPSGKRGRIFSPLFVA